MRRFMTIAGMLLLCLPLAAFGAEIHVPGDYSTIQEGIDAAGEGDTVLVADGTYTGAGNRDLDLGGKAIVVRSENGPQACVIDCEGSGRGFHFHTGEGRDSVVQEFTIRNGDSVGGSGICIEQFSSPTITGNVITENETIGGGGGIMIRDSSPLISGNTISFNSTLLDSAGGGIACMNSPAVIIDNTIAGNTSEYWGGGIFAGDASPIITGNNIIGNHAGLNGGGVFFYDCTAAFQNNLLDENSTFGYGGGMYCWISPVTIQNNLFMENSATEEGGGLYCGEPAPLIVNNTFVSNTVTGSGYGAGIYTGSSQLLIKNCILWSNTPLSIFGDNPTVSYCDVQGGYPGEGNIDLNPLFVSGPQEGDYYLSQVASGQAQDSACVDAGDPGSEVVPGTTRTDQIQDADVVDMGFHYPAAAPAITVNADLSCLPGAGTVPFSTAMSATLINQYEGQTRKIAGCINITLAGGAFYGNWRCGNSNVAAGSSTTSSWLQNIPALGSLIGDNLFQLVVEDVTPVPYNQPPYPPAGDTAAAACTVTGIAS